MEKTLRDIDDGHVEQLMQYLESRGFDYSLGKVSETILSAFERSLLEMVTKKGSENVLEAEKFWRLPHSLESLMSNISGPLVRNLARFSRG